MEADVFVEIRIVAQETEQERQSEIAKRVRKKGNPQGFNCYIFYTHCIICKKKTPESL